MCVVSNIGDMGRRMWPSPFDQAQPPSIPWNPGIEQPFVPYTPGSQVRSPPYNGPTREQFEKFLKLLRDAKKLDTLLGMKDCEMAEKLEWLKAIAAHLGVDVKDLAP